MKRMSIQRVCTALITGALFISCGGEIRQCRVNADCASGVCQADGTCGEPEDTTGTPTPDPSGTPTGNPTATPTPQGCTPNDDGTITADEFVVATGIAVPYRIATDATVDTTGSGSGSNRVWDFSGALNNDANLGVDLIDPSAEWFADSFPDASYAVKLSESTDNLGVYEKTQDGVYLLGVVSPQGGSGRTEMTYDPPVPVLEFPVEVGNTWSVSSDVTGLYQGQTVFATSESYALEADAAGEVVTPLGTFPVIRVKAELNRTVLAQTTTIRTFAFATECYGTVARVISQDDEPNVEFTDAAEVWRLGQ